MGDCAAGWKEKVLNENGKASQCRAYNLWLKNASRLYCPCYKEENFENCPFSRISNAQLRWLIIINSPISITNTLSYWSIHFLGYKGIPQSNNDRKMGKNVTLLYWTAWIRFDLIGWDYNDDDSYEEQCIKPGLDQARLHCKGFVYSVWYCHHHHHHPHHNCHFHQYFRILNGTMQLT